MLRLALLRTRVGRHILVLFVGCVIVPVATFALLAYTLMARRLETAARETLRSESKAAGFIIFDRLTAIATELALRADAGEGASAEGSSFDFVAIERAPGSVATLHGSPQPLPALADAELRHLAQGRPLIVRHSGPRPVFFLVRKTGSGNDGFPRIWGRVLPATFLESGTGLGASMGGGNLCVLDAEKRPLSCAAAEAERATAALEDSRAGEHGWQRGDSLFLMGGFHLFLKHEFGAEAWTVTLSTPADAVRAPLADFRRTFFLGVALAGVLVFAVSHIQLRKRMTPLAELELGVRRVREGDFTTPVAVQSDDEFAVLAESFNGMASDLRRQFETVAALHEVDLAALEHRSADAIARAALNHATALLEADFAVVAFPDGDAPGTWRALARTRDGFGDGKNLFTPGAGELKDLASELQVLERGKAQPCYSLKPRITQGVEELAFPIRHRGGVRAVLLIGSAATNRFSDATRSLGRQLADQLAVGLSNESLLHELDDLSRGSLLALARTIDASSPWTAGHSERVTQTAVEIARLLGLEHRAIERLRRGSLLHDIGKIGVPTAILDKAGPLTEDERTLVQAHPVIGAEIVGTITAFRDIVPLVRDHHELLDGSGYPNGISSFAISQQVRILTVADVYDALVSDRPYRRGLAPEAAVGILREGMSTKYDPDVVQALELALFSGWAATTDTHNIVAAEVA
ncbi:MAG: HD domain-containing protein [Gemmatimonadales bacterium]|nr:HD domain-containing protein [Gemmatimonadales bacterium]